MEVPFVEPLGSNLEEIFGEPFLWVPLGPGVEERVDRLVQRAGLDTCRDGCS